MKNQNANTKFRDIISLCLSILKHNKFYHLLNFFIWLFLSILPLISGFIIKNLFNSLNLDGAQKYFSNLILLAIVLLLNIFLTYKGGLFDIKSRFYIGKFLRVNLFRYFSSVHTKFNNSTLLNMFNTDVNTIEEFISFTIDFINKFLYFIFAFSILYFINPKMTLYVFIPLLMFSFIIYIFGEKIKKYYLHAKKEDIKTINLISSMIKYHSSIKYYNSNNILENLHFHLEKRKRNNFKKQILFEFISKFTEFFNNLSYVIIMVSSLYFLNVESNLGDFTLFIEYISYSSAYLLIFQDIFTKYKSIQKFFDNLKNKINTSSNNLFTILKGKDDSKHINLSPELRLKSFSFNSEMDPINLVLNKGEWLVITGKVGSGKTKFINCLLNNAPYTGEIFVSNKNVSPTQIIHAGYVPQTTHLLDDTLTNNITYYGEFDLYRFNECLKIACVNDDVFKTLISNNTRLGKNGKILSEGQRQRVTIARALYANKGLIIMDNCLANIDLKTKEKIINNLIKQNLTIIIVDENLDLIEGKVNFKHLNI